MRRLSLLLVLFAMEAHAATITVTNVNDSGPGSLRQALSDVMTSGIPRNVNFLIIPTGNVTHAINLLTPLPTLTNSVFIDGVSQPGYSNAPLIRLVSAATNVVHGLRLHGGTNRVRGLYLTGFSNVAVQIFFAAAVLLRPAIS